MFPKPQVYFFVSYNCENVFSKVKKFKSDLWILILVIPKLMVWSWAVISSLCLSPLGSLAYKLKK